METKQRGSILEKLSKIKTEVPSLGLNIMEGSGNSMGARIAGLRPDVGPFGSNLKSLGFNALDVLLETTKDGWDVLYVAGANPAIKFSSKLFQEARAKLNFLVVQDIFLTETAKMADVVLPTLCYVEKGGSFINIEGRVQRLEPGCEVPDGIYSDGDIFKQLAEKLGTPLHTAALQDVLKGEFVNEFIKIVSKQNSGVKKTEEVTEKGMIAATFSKALFDHGTRMNHNDHLVKLAKKPNFRLNESVAKKYGFESGNLVEVNVLNGNAITGTVEVDNRVANETIVLPMGFPEVPVYELANELYNGMMVNIRKL